MKVFPLPAITFNNLNNNESFIFDFNETLISKSEHVIERLLQESHRSRIFTCGTISK